MEKQMLRCDICGGELEMQGGGKAVCASCGMKYSTESLREKFNGLKVSVTGSRDDVAQWKELVNRYIENNDFVAVEGIIKKILEAVPTDQFANLLYEQLQDWKYLEIINNIVVSYFGQGERLVLPKGIKEIGEGAFKESRIKYIEIQEGVVKIGKDAFRGCEQLEEVRFPNSIIEIEAEAFAGCSKLNTLIPANVIKLGDRCFSQCALQFADISNVKDIGGGVFADCESLTQIELPNSLKRVPDGLLGGTGLREYDIPSSIEEVGRYAFEGCKKLRNVRMNSGIKSIEDGAFRGCEVLESVRLPDGFIEIGYNAFENCTSLKTVYIPASVEAANFAQGIFRGCDKLTVVEWSNIDRYFDDGYTWNNDWWEGSLELLQTLHFG